jgi:hypothetical protein
MNILPKIYAAGEIVEREDMDEGIRISVNVSAERKDALLRFTEQFLIKE